MEEIDDSLLNEILLKCSEYLLEIEAIDSLAQVAIVKYNEITRTNYYVKLVSDLYNTPFLHPRGIEVSRSLVELREDLEKRHIELWQKATNTLTELRSMIPIGEKKKDILLQAVKILKLIPFEFPVTEQLYSECIEGSKNTAYFLLTSSFRYQNESYLELRANPFIWLVGKDLEAILFPSYRVYCNTFFSDNKNRYVLAVYTGTLEKAAKVRHCEEVLKKLLEEKSFTFGPECNNYESLNLRFSLTKSYEIISSLLNTEMGESKKTRDQLNEIRAILKRIMGKGLTYFSKTEVKKIVQEIIEILANNEEVDIKKLTNLSKTFPTG